MNKITFCKYFLCLMGINFMNHIAAMDHTIQCKLVNLSLQFHSQFITTCASMDTLIKLYDSTLPDTENPEVIVQKKYSSTREQFPEIIAFSGVHTALRDGDIKATKDTLQLLPNQITTLLKKDQHIMDTLMQKTSLPDKDRVYYTEYYNLLRTCKTQLHILINTPKIFLFSNSGLKKLQKIQFGSGLSLLFAKQMCSYWFSEEDISQQEKSAIENLLEPTKIEHTNSNFGMTNLQNQLKRCLIACNIKIELVKCILDNKPEKRTN